MKLKRLARIQDRETEALKKYRDTNDPKYLQVVRTCIDKREEILLKNFPLAEKELKAA